MVHEIRHGAEDGAGAVAPGEPAGGVCGRVCGRGCAGAEEYLSTAQTGLDWTSFFFFFSFVLVGIVLGLGLFASGLLGCLGLLAWVLVLGLGLRSRLYDFTTL